MKKENEVSTQTSLQKLASIIKSCRNIMRKDKGLSGETDRLPMLTWIMFLKFIDDAEKIRKAESELAGRQFTPAIKPSYRWRDWAGKEDGVTGDELIAFINQEETIRPDGSKGQGLFAYLRSLQGSNGGDRRDVIATVFRGTLNRMVNGYLLRDIINLVNKINFTSSDDIHVLGAIYETMLKEMRDAAGDSGEFYTPRPVVRFIVNVVNPKVGEVVLDPAAGTGGFLVEAYEHLKKQCNKAEDYEKLQRGSLLGIEAKPLPYLLCQMNLLLHGLEYPEIDPGNALRFPLREIGDKDRVDIIMTNPPFGGEEEKGILSNFPEDKQTSETALLFLQLIMRKLKRPIGGKNGGRCGMVVHNGVLFGDGVCAKVKEELLNEFNLHTIVRLPAGVFSPYTDIETNLLFFEKGGPTKEIWYYELPLPEGRKNYTKTRPLQFEEFESCLKWWNNRVENEFAWKVPVEEVSKNNYNLDIKNPNKKNDFEHLPPEKLLESILEKEKKVIEIIEKIKVEINQGKVMIKNSVKNYKFKDFLARAKDRIIIKENEDYKRLTIKTKNGGIFIRDKVLGSLIGTKKQFIVKSGQFLLSKIDAMNGAFGIVPSECDEAIITGNFWAFNVSKNIVDLEFLNYFTFTTNFIDLCMKASTGTTHRKYLDETKFLELEISLPLLSEQQHIVSILKRINSINKIKLEIQSEINALVPSILSKAFKGEL